MLFGTQPSSHVEVRINLNTRAWLERYIHVKTQPRHDDLESLSHTVGVTPLHCYNNSATSVNTMHPCVHIVLCWRPDSVRPAFRKLVWALDLAGIADMYESYELANLWSFITNTPEGLRVSFVKAEHSTFRWAGPEQAVISSHGHAVHTLHKSGHWVHADNPDGRDPHRRSSSNCVT